jgi:hypothetical protein
MGGITAIVAREWGGKAMIKQLGIFRAKPGMERQAFIDRYENGHVPFALKRCPWLSDYRRNYPQKGSPIATAHLEVAKAVPEIDVVSEFKYASQADADRVAAVLSDPTIGQQFAEDEAQLFDRSKMTIIPVEEFATPENELRPRPTGYVGRPAIKFLGFARRRDPELPRDAFIRSYEAGLATLIPRILRAGGHPIFAGYRRNIVADGFANQGHVDIAPPKPDFDVMNEIWFWTEADYRAFQEACASPEVGEQMAAEQLRLFDISSITMIFVDECVTSQEALAEARTALAA